VDVNQPQTLKFGTLLREPDVRKAGDMREVILDQEWAEKNLDVELYYMYRDLWLEEDHETIVKNDLRYDITLIPARSIGKEFVKTKGHYHPECSTGVSFPEIYEVLEGEAHYLLQRPEAGKIVDAVLVEAAPGDKVVIPPNYGHVTINPGSKPLKMANWVSRKFSSIYGDYVERRGAAYYELTDGTFMKNPSYDEVPALRKITPPEFPELSLEKKTPMYNLIKEPEKLAFLNKPQEFGWLFERAV